MELEDILEYVDISFLSSCLEGDIEHIFINYYRRKQEELKGYERVEEHSNKTYGKLLATSDQMRNKALKALAGVEYFTIKSNSISIHYRPKDTIRCVKIEAEGIVKRFASYMNIDLSRETKLISADNIEQATAFLMNEFKENTGSCFDKTEGWFSSNMGKYGKGKKTILKRFIQYLYPYYGFLKAKKPNCTDEELYDYIAEQLALSEYERACMRPYFSDNKFPPPLKLIPYTI